MIFRNRRIEKALLEMYQSLPANLLNFPIDFNLLKSYISTLPYMAIYTYQEYAELNNVSIDDIIVFCNSCTGCTHSCYHGYIIMYNDDEYYPRKLFTLAHELGHHILNHLNDNSLVMIANKSINKSTNIEDTRLEDEADYFAAAFLCPLPIVYKLKLKSSIEIKHRFGISYEAAEIAWRQYQHYERSYNISCHNDIIRVFNHIF